MISILQSLSFVVSSASSCLIQVKYKTSCVVYLQQAVSHKRPFFYKKDRDYILADCAAGLLTLYERTTGILTFLILYNYHFCNFSQPILV